MSDLRQTILVVDDTPENIELLCAVLESTYRTKVAVSGEKALRIANSEAKPDLILLDIMMPGMNGYDVCRTLKANPDTRGIPVIFVTALGESRDEQLGLELGAVDYLTKPLNPPIVRARVKTHLALYDQTRELERMVQLRTRDLESTRREILHRLGRASEFKDNETGRHIIRMSHYSRLIGQAAGMSEASVDTLYHAAAMHDVGKIGIPDYVLLKPGKLDEKEWEIIRRHPEIGAEIIGRHEDDLLQAAHTIALTHHEKWDGSGYPCRIKGDDIPLMGRIVAVADVFDALTSVRPYKTAWTVDVAVRLIEEGSGAHFDPDMVAAFKSMLPEITKIKEQYAEETEVMLDVTASGGSS